MKPMPRKNKTVETVSAVIALFREKQFRAIFLERNRNPVIQLIRYAITGSSTFLVDFLLLFLLEKAGLHYLPASGISFGVGIFCNFLLTKFFAFKQVGGSFGPVGEVLVFLAISGSGLGLTVLFMYLFTSKLHLYFMLSKLCSSMLVFFWNFLGRKFILYPGKKQKPTE